ncbi:DUF6961 family protein [Sphingopyxis granuli]|uniref:DUF6961 family protein n=1 Tax=Sphingopyxis granuli TaxID=267128 RepID=UPI0008354FB1|nr:hypothetical protein [Sphingopyxis granuli]
MGAKADKDLWGQALAIESRYGDRGPKVIAAMISELQRASNYADVEFWTNVAQCLEDLHAIRYPGIVRMPAAENRQFAAHRKQQDCSAATQKV